MNNFRYLSAVADYNKIWNERKERLLYIRANTHLLPAIYQYYSQNISDFISDWGETYDPRNSGTELSTHMPFILFDKQRDFVDWILERYDSKQSGIAEKSRDVGFSWVSVAVACSLCIFKKGFTVGFGSRKQNYVDERGDLTSLLEKARLFMKSLPVEFSAGFHEKNTTKLMLLNFPESQSAIIGETGDGIGRGGRTSLYIVDESAFLERPHLIDSSLSANTNCRIDVSTPNGMANSFAERRFSGKVPVFTLHWRDDPRKDEAWYQKKCEEIDNPVIIAQELDLNYNASVEGIIIPSEWVQSAIDAHIKLCIKENGIKIGAWDVADCGADSNAFAGRYGILLEFLEFWSGANSDLLNSAHIVFNICDDNNYRCFMYDADGLGASVRGDARHINENRYVNQQVAIRPFHGSGEIVNPHQSISKDKTNADFFTNYKSQAWWHLRTLFKNTHRAIHEKLEFDKNEIISISSKIKNLDKLLSELSQPTYSINSAGKILVDKKPNGAKSPNLADAVMMCYAPASKKTNFKINKTVFRGFY